MELEIHPVQASILRELLFNPRARFAELNVEGLSTDHFSFHIKRLVGVELVEKDSQGAYRLTTKGKEFANRFDTEEKVLEKQAKVAVLVCPVRKKAGEKEYLVQERLKQPYYGFFGFITGKIKWGETPDEAAQRELDEETGLEGKLELMGIKHKMDYSQDNRLLEDKYFFVYRASGLEGQLKRDFEGGSNSWMTENDILNIERLFDGVDESLKMIQGETFGFSETEYQVEGY